MFIYRLCVKTRIHRHRSLDQGKRSITPGTEIKFSLLYTHYRTMLEALGDKMSLSTDSNVVELRGLPMLSAFRLHLHGCQAEMSKIVLLAKKNNNNNNNIQYIFCVLCMQSCLVDGGSNSFLAAVFTKSSNLMHACIFSYNSTTTKHM